MSEFFRVTGNGVDEDTEVVHHFPIGMRVRLVDHRQDGIHIYADADDPHDPDPMIQFVDPRHVEPTDE